MQSSNLLEIPFRRSQALSLSKPLRAYIASKYDQTPQSFAQDLDRIDQLRKDAVNALEPHSSGIRKLQAYSAQLVWMTSKFPVDIPGADFIWYPSLGYHTTRAHSSENIRFELANVVFNLAAIYSQLALASNRANTDGLKSAASFFSFAAGVVKFLNTEIVPQLTHSVPESMEPQTLEALEALMLAQAQECFWQFAVREGTKDAIVAKLAVKVSDLYNEAAEWSAKSDSITSEWIHHMNAKHHHFAAAAQYRAALDCLDKRKYGEEVARLRDSLGCVNYGLREHSINQSVQSDLAGLKTKLTEELKRAEKDNDTIYLQPEPSKAELKTIERRSMVEPKVPVELSKSQEMLGDGGELGRALFAELVPYSVHVAASLYSDRRDRLVNNTIIAEIEAMNEKIHVLLSSLNLPGSLQALEKPLGLPSSLSSHAEEIRHLNGIHRLQSTIADTEKVKSNNRNLYNEGVDLLRVEAGEDEAARRKYGTDRWKRLPARDAVPKLYQQVSDIEGYLKQADSSDAMVKDKLRDNESLIRLLAGSDRDLEDYVPSSRRVTMTAKVEREANALRSSLNEVNRLEARRRRKVELLKIKAKEDDVNPDLLKEAARFEREAPMQTIQASQFENFFTRRLSKYDGDQEDLKKESAEQQNLLAKVTDTNAAFQAVKRGDTASSEREKALQKLENAYTAYKDIMRNLETGRKFYNDLSAITTRFRDECKNFVYTRRTEAQSLESDLSLVLAGLQLQQNTEHNLRAQRSQQQHIPPSARMMAEPIPAPTPQRVMQAPPPLTNVQSPQPVSNLQQGPTTWAEGMPIVFGGDPNGSNGPKSDARWDASRGLRFG